MTMPLPMTPNVSEEAALVWHEVTASLATGDIEALQNAIKGFITLSAQDKKSLEDMASLLPYPGLPPQLIMQIFANPEASVGIIERLGPQADGKELIAKLGTAEKAIVLDALLSWLKSEQRIAQTTKDEAAKDAQKKDTIIKDAVKKDAKDATTGSNTNLLNQALESYILNGSTLALPMNMGSLQFLKNNTITLAGLQIADPALLNQAYEIASQQLFRGILPDINTSNLTSMIQNQNAASQSVHDKNRTSDAVLNNTTEASRSQTIQHQLVNDIRKALQDGAIPLNMQTFLVLWTAISLPATPASIGPSLVATALPTNASNQAIATEAALKAQGALAVNGSSITASFLPASPIVASVLASLPTLFENQNIQASTELAEQLGMISYVYSQMAPYWSGPAAVSLMAAQGGEITEHSKTETAVRAFAIALGALLNDPSFDQLLAALIKKTSPNISEEQLKVFISAMKISILTNALVALYIVMLRKTHGQFRADELAQMILGLPVEDRIDLDELQKGVIKSIQTELLYIPVAKRAAFINNLLSTYSQNTDINSLIDPSKQFLNLCDSTLNIDGGTSTKG